MEKDNFGNFYDSVVRIKTREQPLLNQSFIKISSEKMRLKIFFVVMSCALGISSAQYPFPFRPFDPRTDCTNPSKTYCMNEKQYVLCDSGTGNEKPAILSCPIDGEFCSHDVPSSCGSAATMTTNTLCDQCLTGTNGHACLSFTSFKECTEGEKGEEKFCSEGLYCDVYHPNRQNPCRRFNGQQFLCWKEYKAPPPPTEADICEVVNTFFFCIIAKIFN